jgi:D-3-phosphoglycerate dehydrogenase / 2-oxoglutarate reductase
MRVMLICTTSDNIPTWVTKQAKGLGIRFSTLTLPDKHLATRLGEIQPVGYLMNGPPEYGPYFDAALADAAPNLQIVTYFGQSLEPSEYDAFLDVHGLNKRGITVTTTPGATESVAEGTIALLLALNLNLLQHNSARKANQDLPIHTRNGLYGSRLGVVGMGQIGSRVAEVAHTMGMEILYCSRSRKMSVERDVDARSVDLPTLFAECEFVSVHTPSSVTEGLIDDEVLAHAQGITLVNTTSATRIVDPEALLKALDDGRVARAAIEGRYTEPYDSQLRAFGDDRVLLLPPYTSWDTEQSWEIGWQCYLETLRAWTAGEPIPYQLIVR